MVKKGLNDSYDNTIIQDQIRALLDITKPASSIGVMATIPFAAVMFGELYGPGGIELILAEWEKVIYASLTMFFLHGGSQAMNMAEDAEIDKETDHKQNRPIPAGVITEEDARALAWVFIMFGVTRAFTISNQFGYLSVILAFFGVFYNLEPIRAKKHLWVNLGWQAASRGLFLYPAAFAVWGDAWNPLAWGMGLVAFLLVLAMQNTADFADVDIDEKYDIITPAVYHGLDTLTIIMAAIAGTMFVVFAGLVQLDIVPNFWLMYLLVIPIGWSLWSLWNEPRSISDIGGNHFSWYVFYLSLASLYMLPAIQLVLM